MLETPIMSNDVAVLAQVVLERDVSHKAVASILNVHISTVYEWLSGKRTAPLALFRTVYEITGDGRLAMLLTGRLPVTFTLLLVPGPGEAKSPARLPPLGQLLPIAAQAVRAAASGLESIATIVADGKIDQADAATVANFKKHAAEAQHQLGMAVAGVEAQYRKGAK